MRHARKLTTKDRPVGAAVGEAVGAAVVVDSPPENWNTNSREEPNNFRTPKFQITALPARSLVPLPT